MLKHLRHKDVSKKILWVVATVIIISFGFFGTASYLTRGRSSSGSYAGSIFGTRVSVQDYQESYLHAEHQALIQYGENFHKISQFVNLQAEAWDRLILLHEAKKRHIRISDQEVVDAIAEIPMFQRNGKFDPLLYNDILKYVFKTRARFFEEGVRNTLIFNKIYRTVIENISLTEGEIKQGYKEQNENIQVSYAFIKPDSYLPEITIDENEAKDYFGNHAADFALPAAVNVQYIRLPFPENADDTAKSTVGDKAQEVFQALKSNPNFTQIAQQFKMEAKETGFFSEDRPNLNLGWSFELLQQVFKLTDDSVSVPIEAEDGYFIFRIKERRPAALSTFEEARDKVFEVLKMQKAWDLAAQRSKEIVPKLQNTMIQPDSDFTKVVQTMNLDLQQTPAFHRGQYLPGIGISKEFQEAAFALKDSSDVSQPVRTEKGFCILHLTAHFPIDEAKYQQEKETFRNSLLVEKSNEATNELMAQLRTKANLQDNISRLRTNPDTSSN